MEDPSRAKHASPSPSPPSDIFSVSAFQQTFAKYKTKITVAIILFVVTCVIVTSASASAAATTSTTKQQTDAPELVPFVPKVPPLERENLQKYLTCEGKPLDDTSFQFSVESKIKDIHSAQEMMILQIIDTDYLSISKKDSFEEVLQWTADAEKRQTVLDDHIEYWGKVYAAGKSYLKNGGHPKPMALWQAMYDFENDPSMSSSGASDNTQTTMQDFYWSGNVIPVPSDMLVVGFRQLLMRKAMYHMNRIGFGPGSDGDGIFIETGAGWGRNLFFMLNNIFMPSRTARVYMGEFSSSGRAVARMLGDLRRVETKDNNVFVGPFDYYNPSLCWVSNMEKKLNPSKPVPDRAVILTSYSIEQIPLMFPTYMEVMLTMAKKVVGIHIEPINSQMRGKKGDEITTTNVVAQYNTNFIELLYDYEAKGKIKILEMNPDWGDVPGGGRDRAGLVIWESV